MMKESKDVSIDLSIREEGTLRRQDTDEYTVEKSRLSRGMEPLERQDAYQVFVLAGFVRHVRVVW